MHCGVPFWWRFLRHQSGAWWSTWCSKRVLWLGNDDHVFLMEPPSFILYLARGGNYRYFRQWPPPVFYPLPSSAIRMWHASTRSLPRAMTTAWDDPHAAIGCRCYRIPVGFRSGITACFTLMPGFLRATPSTHRQQCKMTEKRWRSVAEDTVATPSRCSREVVDSAHAGGRRGFSTRDELIFYRRRCDQQTLLLANFLALLLAPES